MEREGQSINQHAGLVWISASCWVTEWAILRPFQLLSVFRIYPVRIHSGKQLVGLKWPFLGQFCKVLGSFQALKGSEITLERRKFSNRWKGTYPSWLRQTAEDDDPPCGVQEVNLKSQHCAERVQLLLFHRGDAITSPVYWRYPVAMKETDQVCKSNTNPTFRELKAEAKISLFLLISLWPHELIQRLHYTGQRRSITSIPYGGIQVDPWPDKLLWVYELSSWIVITYSNYKIRY